MFLLLAIADYAAPVTRERARQLASAYMKSGVEPRMIQRKNSSVLVSEAEPLYVFSRGQGEGFVIVSGDDRMPAVIGYAERGDYNEDSLPPQLKDMLDYYTQMAQQLSVGDLALATNQPRMVAGTQDIPALMTSHHHQNWPYNNLCPYIKETTNRAATGCVATAASQIIYYWRKDLDDRTRYNTPTYSYGDAPVTESIPSGTPLKWDLMYDSYTSGDPAESQGAIATLVACVGASAWLTYGSSTSGQIDNCRNVFSGQFGMNGGKTVWRGSYSQTSWEKLIVSELEAGRPILYSGVHPSNGGHAVVVDGYRLSDNLFHFNFGWGGQGDGYYTVDETTGMNGFNDSQGMVCEVYPKSFNLEGSVSYNNDHLMSRMPNTIKAHVTNNSTLPYSGVYLYCTTASIPTGTAQGKDTDTEIAVGETAEFTFSFTPTGTSTYNIYLCDKNKNVLAQINDLETEATVPDLMFNALSIDDGGTSENLTVGDESLVVKHVYNTKKAQVTVSLTNSAQATVCMPSVQGVVMKYVDGTFTKVSTKTKKDVIFQPGQSADLVYDLTGLSDGDIYRFSLLGTASTNKIYDLSYATADTVVYFRLMGEGMTFTPSADGHEVKVAGNFNASLFTANATDPTVSRYDLTAVQGLQPPLVAANPNALFYVSAASRVSGTNIIADGVTASLELTPGYDFEPKADFYAQKAVYHATQPTGLFSTLILPFDAITPSGMFARRVVRVSGTTMQEVDSCNLQLKSGTPYLTLLSRAVDVEADHVSVSIGVSSEGTDTLRGTWINRMATANQYVLDQAATQYFNLATGDTIPALTAYMEYDSKVRAYSTTYGTKDRKALQLAQQIVAVRALAEANEYYASVNAMEALMAVVAEAEDSLRSQPQVAFQTAQINALKSAAEAFEQSLVQQPADGSVDFTSSILNPSFEIGSLKNWTAKSSVLNRITTSKSMFMSGSDGNCVVRINTGGSLSQTLTGLQPGRYTLRALVAADYGHHISLFAGTDTLSVEATDFGPMYLAEASIENIEVMADGTLTIGAMADEGWAKVDNFRLYQTAAADAIEDILPDLHVRHNSYAATYDLNGRVIRTTSPMRGVYIQNGRKVIITK